MQVKVNDGEGNIDPASPEGTLPTEDGIALESAVDEHRHPERYYREQLQAERGALENFLRELPVESVIDRLSLESRLEEVRELLCKSYEDYAEKVIENFNHCIENHEKEHSK